MVGAALARILEIEQRLEYGVKDVPFQIEADPRGVLVGRGEREAKVLALADFRERNRFKRSDGMSVGDRALEPLSAHLRRSARVRLRG